MNYSRNKLYFLAFLLALGLRFVQLGALPLSDSEAVWALQALQVAQGSKPLLGPQPGYILLTSIPFFIFGGTNFLARFWPALAGSALVFAPCFFRKQLGERPALVLAFGLALEPGLVAVSRGAGGMMLAIAFTLLAWAMWQDERPGLAGIFGGLALLGGPSLWAGLLGLGLAWAIAQGVLPPAGTESGAGGGRVRTEGVKTALTYGLGTLLLAGTLFFLVPNGLSAGLSSLSAYALGWRTPGVPARQLLGALLAYQPLALVFGAISAARGWLQDDRTVKGLSLWLLTTLVLALAYPAHQVSDLAWALLPLWALAAIELARHLRIPAYDRIEAAGVAALTLVLLIFTWLNLAGLSLLPAGSPLSTNRLLLLGGSLLLLLLSLALVAMGWTVETATLGGTWGAVIVLGFYTLGTAWGATGLRTPSGVELWNSGTRVAQADLLLQTIDDLSTWSSGNAKAQPVTISGVDSPALRWLLRDHEVIEAAFLDFSSAPPLVITPQTDELNLAATYRGQDFVWRQAPPWGYILPSDWTTWLVRRQLPQDSETIILWVRDDLFFDGQSK
ncbi:MAG: hypothetical protein GXP40_08895 [Chloroflexi bacterium]|nr:hypothetical protein [Chloroflexota bacterium]